MRILELILRELEHLPLDLYVLPASQVLGLESFNCMISVVFEPNQST